jgi:hypothetical protein
MSIRTIIILVVLLFPALAFGESPKKMCDNAIAPLVQSAVGKVCEDAIAEVSVGCLAATAGMMAMQLEMAPEISAMCLAVDVTIAAGCNGFGVYPQSMAEPDMNTLCAAFPQ